MKANLGRLTVYAFFLSLLTLTACDELPTSPKQPHVVYETASHPVAFADGVTRLYPAERDALGAFTSSIHSQAALYIGLAADDRKPAAVARARAVRDYLVAQGFEKKVIHLQPTPKMDPRTVLLTVQYAKGIPPQPCPDWSKNATHNYNDGNASNFGCAYNNNLILQLADPEDYNKGEGAPHFDGARDSAVLGHYLADTAQPAGGGGGGSTTTTSSSPSP